MRLLALVLALSGAASAAAEPARVASPHSPPTPAGPLWIDAPAGAPAGPTPDLAPLIRRLESSVVRLSVAVRNEPARRTYATGFVISSRGYLITSEALLGEGSDLRASFEGKRELPVELVGHDPNTEIALLRVAPEQLASEGISLVPLPLGDSSSLRVGDGVITLGHADSEGSSAAQGIVAGRDLRIAPLGKTGSHYLRLDMLLVAGFGGAPLVDLRGRVVGVVSGERTGGYELDSISFAVPIEAAKSVIPDLAHSGTVPTGWLGVAVQPVSVELAEKFGLPDSAGALVSEVLKGSPAEKAHLQQGDVILEFDGQRLQAYRDLSVHVARVQPGSEVALEVLRGGTRKQLRAVIETKLDTLRQTHATPSEGGTGWGFECAELTSDLTFRFSLPAESRGIVVSRLDPGGPAQQAGLQLGDRVLEINGEPLEALERLNALRGLNSLILLVERADRSRFVELSR